MNPSDLRSRILEALLTVAPEADPATIRPDVPLRDQLDLDSFDLLRFLTELHRTVGIDVPEADYAKVATVDSAIAYLSARLEGGGAPRAPA